MGPRVVFPLVLSMVFSTVHNDPQDHIAVVAALHLCRHEATAEVSSHAPIRAEDGEGRQDNDSNESEEKASAVPVHLDILNMESGDRLNSKSIFRIISEFLSRLIGINRERQLRDFSMSEGIMPSARQSLSKMALRI